MDDQSQRQFDQAAGHSFSRREALSAQFKTIREGFEYEVIVTRNVPDTRERAIFRVATEPPAGEPEARTITFYGIAHGPGSGPGVRGPGVSPVIS